MRRILAALPERLRIKILFRLGLFQIPMMGYIRPKIVELTENKVTVRVRLSRRTKNMYASMYLGALDVGADCVAGFFPAKFMFETGYRIPPIIKSSTVAYFKRVTSEAHFSCEDGKALYDVCKQAVTTGKRIERTVVITVTAPSEFGAEPVATFTYLLSLKKL